MVLYLKIDVDYMCLCYFCKNFMRSFIINYDNIGELYIQKVYFELGYIVSK